MTRNRFTIDPRSIERFEVRFNVKLPDAYIKLYEEYGDTDVPAEDVAHVDPRTGASDPIAFSDLTEFEKANADEWDIFDANTDNAKPEGLIVFAEEGGGRDFCLDYRSGGEPSVVVFQPEYVEGQQVIQVAGNFDEFLHLVGLSKEPKP